MKRTVYLAGPIAGLTEDQAKDWRLQINQELKDKSFGGIVGISPLRCETAIDGRYDILGSGQGQDARFGTVEAIAAKNDFDVRNCDMMLALLEDKSSAGTLVEIGMAKALNKPVIVVSDNPDVRGHPLIRHCASWVLTYLDEAVDVIIGVMEDYT